MAIKEITPRKIDLPKDRDVVLEFHCRNNYASETPYGRKIDYEKYRQKWFSTSQVEAYLAHIAQSQADERTLAVLWEDRGTVVGLLWVLFTDLSDYDIVIAEMMDLGVAPEYRRRGIGSMMVQHAVEHARKVGVTLFRTGTGVENLAAQKLHEKLGFHVYNISYELVLR